MQETQQREPRTPQKHFINILDVDDTKNKDKFVENKIPKFIFEVLLFGNSQFTEH